MTDQVQTPPKKSNLPTPEKYAIPGSEARRIRNNETRADRRLKRVQSGLCRDCGLTDPFPTQIVCEPCFKSRQERQANRKIKIINNKQCVQCNNINDRSNRTLCSLCNEIQVQNARDIRKRNKLFIINYFGEKCCECGQNDIRCLTLDHIDKDGHLDRKTENGKKQLTPVWYAKLIKLIHLGKELPRRLQLLCYNCHAKKDLCPWWLK